MLSHQYFFYDLVAGADLPRNACPSLHAAFGVFTAGCAWEVFWGWKNSEWFIGAVWSWTAAVLASTLLIKQHVFLDLLAGSVLGSLGWWSMRWQPKRSSVRWPGRARIAEPPRTQSPGMLSRRTNDVASRRHGTPSTPPVVRSRTAYEILVPPAISTTGASAIVEVLKLLEVERVFGLPGVQNIELFDALADAPFATFTPTNESAAVFMADAHARVTGKLGVAVVTAGPGLTNALTGIAEAQLDSSPVLILVGASDRVAGKSFQLHQIQQSAVVKPLVKGYFEPATVEEIPVAILRAAALARRGEPGPTVVEVASTLLMERGGFTLSCAPSPAAPCEINVQLDDAAERLRRSASVGIYAGAGAIGATGGVEVACGAVTGARGHDDFWSRCAS